MNSLAIRGGTIYDPASGAFEKKDIAVEGTQIAVHAQGSAVLEVSAENHIVVPGLIDYHIHLFSGSNEGSVNADTACIPCGVTTAVDGGTSGAPSYPLFHRADIVPAQVRIKSYLNIASTGLITSIHGEHVQPEEIEANLIKEMFRRYPGELVSLKLRNSIGVIPEGSDKPLRAILELAKEIGCNVVIHMTNPALKCEYVAELLRPGDVFCHMYQGAGDTILDENGKVKSAVREARERGVVFDACNGNANFAFSVAEKACEQGFWPDIISSDLTPMSLYQPYAFSLPFTMSKYLALGLPLGKVLDCATVAPARQLGLEDELATLRAGTTADIAIFELADKKTCFYDRAGGSVYGEKLLIPKMTIKDGRILYAQPDIGMQA